MCFSNADFDHMKTDLRHVLVSAQLLSRADSATPWALVRQAPLVVAFFWQEYWSRLPFPSPGDLSDPGVKPVSPVSPVLQRFLYHRATWEACASVGPETELKLLASISGTLSTGITLQCPASSKTPGRCQKL